MLTCRASLAVLISAALVAPHAFASHVHRSPTSGQSGSTHKLSQTRRHSTVRHARGQQAIDPDRVSQIQTALIREHYLSSDANGKWDTTTQAAMQKYQADNGWQTKLMPDSRAIKKLGLGPDYSTAINAKTGNFTPPTSASNNTPAAQTSGFAAASGVKE
jgi:hypothetical protein